MIKYVYANELPSHGELGCSMFRDRARQFHDRLKWDVSVDALGQECDQYDTLNPLYVIWSEHDGSHGGSMRFLPTVGRCMVNEHFNHLLKGKKISSPTIWECTRFCLAPGSGSHVAAALMLGGGELMQGIGIKQFVGVFDRRMRRVYQRIGASPEIVGSIGEGRDQISIGVWSFSEERKTAVASAAGVLPCQTSRWFRESSIGQFARFRACA